jgi:nucleotide-binding universal stress UspA family protein
MKPPDATTRVSFANILYSTDFSPAAEAALPYALAIAARYDSKVFAVHVVAPDSYTLVPSSVARAIDGQTKDAIARLEGQLKAVPHEMILQQGETWPVISGVVKEKDIDLLVLGTEGRTGLEKYLLGSTAEAIFRQANCPVLTVGPHTSKDVERLSQMREIVYATDFTPESFAALPYAVSLAQENAAHLTLLHVIDRPKAHNIELLNHVVDTAVRVLGAVLPPEAELWCKPELLVEYGHPAETILQVADAQKADLIVLGVRRADGRIGVATHVTRPTAHKVVSHAGCPVLTVRA